MPICTACGAVTHPEDEHICDPADVPAKGEKNQPKYDKKPK